MIIGIPNVIWKSAWKYLVSPRVCYVFKDYADMKNNFEIFSKARELYIYAGELYSDFYNDQVFIDNLTEAVKARCQVHVILGPALYANNEKFFSLACKPDARFKFYKRPYRDDAHFKIIVDGEGRKWAVIDRKHPIGAGSDRRGRSVLLLRGYEQEIRGLMWKFEQQREQSKAIKPCDIIDEFSKPIKSGKNFYGFIVPRDGGVELAEEPKVMQLKDTFGKICNPNRELDNRLTNPQT